jgi:hypothetical protein
LEKYYAGFRSLRELAKTVSFSLAVELCKPLGDHVSEVRGSTSFFSYGQTRSLAAAEHVRTRREDDHQNSKEDAIKPSS